MGLGIRTEGAVSTILPVFVPFAEISGEPWAFHRTRNYDLNLSYLALKGARLLQPTLGAHFKSGLLSDVMEEMIKIMHFPYARALNCYLFMGIWK